MLAFISCFKAQKGCIQVLQTTQYVIREGNVGEVNYVVNDGVCVFSGITPSGEAMSTINAAEDIIKAIASREGIKPMETTFFDLVTSRSYSHLEGDAHEFKRLDATYDENGEPQVTAWEDAVCPPETLRLFGLQAN